MNSRTLTKPSRIFTDWLIHFGIAWLIVNILTVFNYFVSLVDFKPDLWQYLIDHNLNPRDMGLLIALTLLSELNYHLFFERDRLGTFFMSSVLTCVILSAMLFFFPLKPGYIPALLIMFLRGPMIFLLLYPLLYGFSRSYYAGRIHQAETEARHFETELNGLKAQVNPHFFFNTFNYLYGTALMEKAEKTAEGIDMMSSMMRYTLTGMQKTFVPLSDELDFLETYITLQRLRIPVSEKIHLDFKITGKSEQVQIAPLLLIPFVENAFKYGLSVEQECRIVIQVNVQDRKLEFSTENTIISTDTVIEGTKNGISLTRQRLELLYPHKHTITCFAQDGIYKVNLTVLP